MRDESSATSDSSKPDPNQRLLSYVQHRPDCAWLEVQWHKGACDCGLFTLLVEVRQANGDALPVELTDPTRGLVPPG